MDNQQIIKNQLAANIKLHIEANELQDATLGFLAEMSKLRDENRFLSIKLSARDREIVQLKLRTG